MSQRSDFGKKVVSAAVAGIFAGVAMVGSAHAKPGVLMETGEEKPAPVEKNSCKAKESCRALKDGERKIVLDGKLVIVDKDMKVLETLGDAPKEKAACGAKSGCGAKCSAKSEKASCQAKEKASCQAKEKASCSAKKEKAACGGKSGCGAK